MAGVILSGTLTGIIGAGLTGWGINGPDIDLNLAGWADVAHIVIAVVALPALIATYLQVRSSREASKGDREKTQVSLTYQYSERLPALIIDHMRDTKKLDRIDNPDKKYAVFSRWPSDKYLRALAVPNLIEEIAGMFNLGLLHKPLATDFFGGAARDLWDEWLWFIERLRASEKDADYYVQWELMLQQLGYLHKND
jgi:hypothetical protein